MTNVNNDLALDWVGFAKASLETRIEDISKSTMLVLEAVQTIVLKLDDQKDSEVLQSLKGSDSTPAEIMVVLRSVLEQLDKKSSLAQLIEPLFIALQFEDRTRQKLEGLIGIVSVWSHTRGQADMPDEALAKELLAYVVTTEQKAVLAQYFPDHIELKTVEEDVSFF